MAQSETIGAASATIRGGAAAAAPASGCLRRQDDNRPWPLPAARARLTPPRFNDKEAL